jgi:hypothetical protein
MNALTLPIAGRPLVAACRRTTDPALDLRGSRIHLATGRGLVTAFYLDAKPRRDATVIPLAAGHWSGSEPAPEVMRHARLLHANGVSVLLVDVRGCEGWRARLAGRRTDGVVRCALDYLVARGHDESDCIVDGRAATG